MVALPSGYLSPVIIELLAQLTSILTAWLAFDSGLDSLNAGYDLKPNHYDFIIVGAGSSGCALANRLSEKYSVLLLEAGGTPNPIVSIPTLTYALYSQDSVIWRRYTEPQTHASFGLKQNRTFWPNGLGLGGSSLLNGMIYIRGNTLQFDDIAKEMNDPRWSLNNVLRYFKKIENYNGHFKDGSHGRSGGMSIERGHNAPLVKNYLEAGQEMGYPVRDPNPQGPLTEGFAPMDFYMKNGRRWDSYRGFLEPILNRTTLTIHKYSFVKRVLMHGNEAFGVVYDRHGKEKVAFANMEVIISAGAIATGKLLMLSGIGPRQHLEDIGVKVHTDLPVGKVLQDKLGVLVGPFAVDPGNSFSMSRDVTPTTYADWQEKGIGPLATSTADATFSISSSISKALGTENDPDIHTYCIAMSMDNITKYVLQDSFNLKDELREHYAAVPKGMDSFFQMVSLPKPKGTGYMKLKDKNPYSDPILQPNYLQNQQDVDVLVEAIKISVDLVDDSASFKKINGQFSRNIFPGCEGLQYKSRQYYECIGRSATMTAYKYCGTAPMGPPGGEDSVVDSHLRVYGMKRLRVVDSSVLQEKYTSVNDVSCKMLGYLAGDIIMDDWNKILSADNNNSNNGGGDGRRRRKRLHAT